MDIRENSFWYKLKEKLIPVLAVIAVAILIWFAFGDKIPGLIPLLKEGDSQKIADYLAQETGIKGVIAVILLQAVQIASIVMPGMAIQIAAGLIYGWLEGFLMCYIGFPVREKNGQRQDQRCVDGQDQPVAFGEAERHETAVYGCSRQHGARSPKRHYSLYCCKD